MGISEVTECRGTGRVYSGHDEFDRENHSHARFVSALKGIKEGPTTTGGNPGLREFIAVGPARYPVDWCLFPKNVAFQKVADIIPRCLPF